MKPVIAAIARLGSSLHPLATVSLVLLTNVFWVVTLRAFGASFERIAGVPVLDLQNTRGILSPDGALELINAYSDNAVTLYWTFFVVDNFVPLLSFGSFALLWAFLLLHSPFLIGPRLARSWLLLLPFGVGLFDIGENLLFVSAITAPDLESQRRLLAVGLVLVRIKGIVPLRDLHGHRDPHGLLHRR